MHAQNSYWSIKKEVVKSNTESNQKLNKEKYQKYKLDTEAFASNLKNISAKSSINSETNVVMSFPNQKGELERFSVFEASVMAPHIAAKHPEIKTYKGYGIDIPNSKIRFTVSPHGVQTMTTYIDKPTVYTVPMDKENSSNYISYESSAQLKPTNNFRCLTEDIKSKADNNIYSKKTSDQILRTFRIAISTTGEYTNFWDAQNSGSPDAQADALAQVVSTLNRINGIFETDMAINFQLVSGTEIIYTNSNTDPYSISGNFGSELQNTLDNEIGSDNYDIGHLFDFGSNDGSGGCIGCVCEDGKKGRGYSMHQFTDNDGGPYMSDFFDLNFVSHEIGHQLGANHTWSFSSEGNGVNYEPGSGSTIMGYAGITGNNNVQNHSDSYFHYASIEQILTNITSSRNNCWTSTPITNNPPIANAGNDYTIPAGTAFVLRGSATDDNTNLSYSWEQIDDGVTEFTNFGPDKVSGATFRSRISNNSNRYMPTISRILSGELTETNPVKTINNTSWETISNVSRELNFALTVREVSAPSNQTGSDLMRITVDANAGPFVVTSQTSAKIWERCSTQNISWDVANTDTGSVNTATVNIKLSIDGGQTYPFMLVENAPNDGSQNIVVPDVGVSSVTTARVMVEANNNIFFAINNVNFTVQNSIGSVKECPLAELILYPNPSNGSFILDMETNNSEVILTLFDLKGSLIKTLTYTSAGDRLSERVVLENIRRGIYILNITNARNSYSRKLLIE